MVMYYFQKTAYPYIDDYSLNVVMLYLNYAYALFKPDLVNREH